MPTREESIKLDPLAPELPFPAREKLQLVCLSLQPRPSHPRLRYLSIGRSFARGRAVEVVLRARVCWLALRNYSSGGGGEWRRGAILDGLLIRGALTQEHTVPETLVRHTESVLPICGVFPNLASRSLFRGTAARAPSGGAAFIRPAHDLGRPS